MDRQQPDLYEDRAMTKEQFFYAYKELAQTTDSHLSLKVDVAGRYVWLGLIRL